MDFVGRDKELAYLEREWSSSRSTFIPIYGRRRVGKSELIVHFLDGREGLYFLGKQTPADLQIRDFLLAAARLLNEPLIAEVEGRDWLRAFELLIDRWPPDRKLVIALDEFQWTVGASPELPSVLQGLWDRRLRDDGRFMLIVCGSYVGFMEREVLGKKSPLFGRRSGIIHLQPFDHREARLFHPAFSLANSARTYFICGGVPAYLRSFRDGHSVESNIRQAILDEFGPLYDEPEFLLREELREVQNYYAILMRLAEGSAAPREIALAAGVPERNVHYYLDQLAELGYVRKRGPLTDQSPSPRRVRHVLADPLLRFWFRFVYPNLAQLKQAGPEAVFDRKIRPELEAWYGSGFEQMCRDALPDLYESEGVRASYEIGEYWDRDVQIDVVSIRDDAWTDVGECKWGALGSAKSVARGLQERARRFPNARGATLGLRAFVRTVPKNPPTEVKWHGLEELYAQ